MPAPKRPRDGNQLAKLVVDAATGRPTDHPSTLARCGLRRPSRPGIVDNVPNTGDR